MALIDYKMDDNAAILSMNSGENRFNPQFIDAFSSVLDQIENNTKADILVVKSSHEKIWSNGIDLDWFKPVVEKGDTGVSHKFLAALYGLMKRVLTYPMITVAAITGHAFAGGAFLSFAHDFRFMRSDRGWICFPEVDLGMTLGPVFLSLCRRAVPLYKLEEMQYTGIRLTAQECEAHHIIKKACHMDSLMDEAMAFAKTQNKYRAVIQAMKAETHKEIISIIDETVSFLSG